jgi:mono/diheme cytochrome c family protein
MLAWGDLGLLDDRQIDEMVAMIRSWEPTAPETSGPTAPESPSAAAGDADEGAAIFAQFCSGCHGFNGEAGVGEAFILREAVASLDDAALASHILGGSEAMPPFHALLTTDDISDLLAMMRTWHAGPAPVATPIVLSAAEVYGRVCARCHGMDGEGGIGPALNSKEFLTANDNEEIRQWIIRGTFGTSMLSWGDLGLLAPEQIMELVDFIRAWEASAPSTAGATSTAARASASLGDATHGEQLFAQFCSGCHGVGGSRSTAGIILNSTEFLDGHNDEIIASQIQNGGREMPSFHSILTGQDVNDLLSYMRNGFSGAEPAGEIPSFAGDVLPIFAEKCAMCHGAAGGWSAATYDDVMTTGNHAPVVIQGDPTASLLAQKILGTQSAGGIMPPGGLMPDAAVQIVLNWIAAGAPDN